MATGSEADAIDPRQATQRAVVCWPLGLSYCGRNRRQ